MGAFSREPGGHKKKKGRERERWAEERCAAICQPERSSGPRSVRCSSISAYFAAESASFWSSSAACCCFATRCVGRRPADHFQQLSFPILIVGSTVAHSPMGWPGACEASLLVFSHSGPTDQVMISDNVEIICMLSIVVVSMFLSRFMGLPPKRGQPYDTTDKDRMFQSWVPKSILIFWSNAVKLARVQENRAPSASWKTERLADFPMRLQYPCCTWHKSLLRTFLWPSKLSVVSLSGFHLPAPNYTSKLLGDLICLAVSHPMWSRSGVWRNTFINRQLISCPGADVPRSGAGKALMAHSSTMAAAAVDHAENSG